MAIIAVILAVLGVAIGYVLYVSTFSPESKAVNVSRQSPVVQHFISQHPSADYRVSKLYVKSDGSVYTVNSDWELVAYAHGTGKPKDGKDHYCWKVFWYEPSEIMFSVSVYVDKDSWEIVLVEETP